MIDKKFDCTISPGSRVVWENKRGWYIHLEIREIFNNRTAAVFISFTPEFKAVKTISGDLDAPFKDVSGQEGANYKKQKTIDISVTVKEDALFHIINRGCKKRPWPVTDLYIKVKSVKSESIIFEVGQSDRIGEACIIDAAAPKIKTDGRLPKSEEAQNLEVGAKQCENAQTYELSVKAAAFMASLIKFVNLTPKVLEAFDKRIDKIESLIKKQSS